MAVVHRYEGTVNQVMGDGIDRCSALRLRMKYHAIRAVFAALAMHAAIRTYAEEARRTYGISVQMRVGLNSGEVVVRAIGNALHMITRRWVRPRIWRRGWSSSPPRGTSC